LFSGNKTLTFLSLFFIMNRMPIFQAGVLLGSAFWSYTCKKWRISQKLNCHSCQASFQESLEDAVTF
jgi:hypothetical protein